MAKLKKSDFRRDAFSGEWQACKSLSSGEIIIVSVEEAPDEPSLAPIRSLLDQIGSIKLQVFESPKESIQTELRCAFESAGLPGSIENIQVWFANISDIGAHTLTASLTASICDQPVDPRQINAKSPKLLICLTWDADSGSAAILDIERLSDMED